MQQEPRAPWLTLANGLPSLRVVLAPVCAFALLDGRAVIAMVCFALAVATDMSDGWLARRLGHASAFGGLFDHATDAWFVCLGLSALAARQLVPVALPVLIALAFTQYMLDSRALEGQRLRASWLGRSNGVAYFVLLGIPSVRDGLSLPWPDDLVVTWIGRTLLLSTALSMADRALAWIATRRARASRVSGRSDRSPH